MTMLITGASGKLGRELVKVFPRALKPSRQEFDITDRERVLNYLCTNDPKIVIHTAALTNVTECEINREKAYKINVQGTENVVRFLSSNCYFVLISTACVFHGDVGDYTEHDLPYPKNYYSLTKLLAETIVKSSRLHNCLIIRTNFVAREKWRYPKAFIDRFGTYLFADDVALAIKETISAHTTGIIHICGVEKMSMFDLARITTPDIKPMTMKEYTGIAPLTVDMSLSSIRINPFKIRGEVM